MERALKPSLILLWAYGGQPRPRRKRGNLNRKETTHQGATVAQLPKWRLMVPNGTVNTASSSLQLAGPRRDTNAL
jgi:hypothetical protein